LRPKSVLCFHSYACITLRSRTVCAALTAVIGLLSVSPSANAQPSPTTVQPIPAWQEVAGGKMEFEVASIRPAAPGASWHSNMDFSVEDAAIPPGGRLSTTTKLGGMVNFAYKLLLAGPRADEVYGRLPKWVSTEFFTIEAKAPRSDVTKDQFRLMMQSLLADRFKLAVHFESREMPVLALVQIKPGHFGPHLRLHSEGPPCDATIPPVDRKSPTIPDVWMPVCGSTQLIDWTNDTVILGSRNTTMEMFANYTYLIESLGLPVVDQTGLTGKFDIEANFAPPWKTSKAPGTDAISDFAGPTFLQALKDDLGLKLVRTRAVIQTIVIDHVEQPSPN
jgi:bla regulator protein blaR1